MITSNEVKQSLPKDIRKKDPFLSKYLLRRLSFPLAATFINHGWSANQVSLLGMIVLVAGLCFFVPANYFANITGALLLNIYIFFDCIDGCIARATNKKSNYGELLEAINGYLIGGINYFAIGWSVAHMSSKLPLTDFRPNYFLLGAITCVCNLLIRVVNLKSQTIFHTADTDTQTKGIMHFAKRVDKEIGVGGLLHILVIICALLNQLQYYVIFYFVYYLLSALFYIIAVLVKYRKNS